MQEQARKILQDIIINYPGLACCAEQIWQAFVLLRQCYANGGKVLICGNGGSAADAEHIVGELMKGFLRRRELPPDRIAKFQAACPDDWSYLTKNLQGALPAISLVSQTAFATAFINDVTADMVFAQQVYGYAQAGDVLIAISTSGNSRNVLNAVKVAKVLGASTIGLSGQTGGRLIQCCDVNIAVPATSTARIQELHLPVYHTLCAMIEAEFFAE